MYRATGDAAHEWIGVSVCAVCITHNALNRNWYKNIFKGAYNFRRGVLAIINLLLVVAMAALIITGLMHSRAVLALLNLPGGMLLRLIHTTSAYWCLPLIGAHLGLNWGMILNAFRKVTKTNRVNHTGKIILRTITLALVVFGVWSSFDRDMFSKLFLGFSFDYWPEERPVILFFVVNLSIMVMYGSITHYTLKIFDWLHQRNTT
jgi:hypothetical protein